MTKESLYHFFPRKSKGPKDAINVLKSIFENGIYLTKEIIVVPWADQFAKNSQRALSIEQYRFCLTAISNKDEFINHSEKFGYIGLGFTVEFITKLGGFPVFYVPSPPTISEEYDDHRGISLLYRIAEMQELLEYIIENKIITSRDIDIHNTLGAVRLLANICYPTERKSDKNSTESTYYNQREWRIIYGLTSEKTSFNRVENTYVLQSYNNIGIANFINKIVIGNLNQFDDEEKQFLLHQVNKLTRDYKLNIEIENINS